MYRDLTPCYVHSIQLDTLLGLGLWITSHHIASHRITPQRPIPKAHDGPIPQSTPGACLHTRKGSCVTVLSLSREKRFLCSNMKYSNLLSPPFVACHMPHLTPRQFSSQDLAYNGLIPVPLLLWFCCWFQLYWGFDRLSDMLWWNICLRAALEMVYIFLVVSWSLNCLVGLRQSDG